MRLGAMSQRTVATEYTLTSSAKASASSSNHLPCHPPALLRLVQVLPRPKRDFDLVMRLLLNPTPGWGGERPPRLRSISGPCLGTGAGRWVVECSSVLCLLHYLLLLQKDVYPGLGCPGSHTNADMIKGNWNIIMLLALAHISCAVVPLSQRTLSLLSRSAFRPTPPPSPVMAARPSRLARRSRQR